jgi:hypothetical protein
MCDNLRTPRVPPSIFGARRGEIQDDLDPVSISAPTSWCASVVPCSVTAAMLTSRFGPICSIALGSSKEMHRRCQLPSRASGSSSSLMAVRYTEPIRTLGRSIPSQVPGLDARHCGSHNPPLMPARPPAFLLSCPKGSSGTSQARGYSGMRYWRKELHTGMNFTVSTDLFVCPTLVKSRLQFRSRAVPGGPYRRWPTHNLLA